MRKIILKTSLTAATILAVFLISPATAQNARTNNERALQAREAIQTRLEENKLRLCQNRERVINQIMGRIAERGERRLNVYSTIADRVMEFYTNRGLSVDNYDELITDLNAKKEAAEQALEAVKAAQIEFQCDGTDPKGAAGSFKQHLKAEINALHDYQQSIKDLIVAVKTSIGDGQAEEAEDE